MKREFYTAVFLGGCVLGLSAYADATRSVSKRENTPTLRECERQGRKRGSSPAAILACKAIACQESSCGRNPVPNREKSREWHKKAAPIARTRAEYNELMSSWGSLQLSGVYTFLESGVPPTELLDDQTSIALGLPRIERHLSACNQSTLCVYARWNGGPGWRKSRKEAREAVKKYATLTKTWESKVY